MELIDICFEAVVRLEQEWFNVGNNIEAAKLKLRNCIGRKGEAMSYLSPPEVLIHQTDNHGKEHEAESGG